LKRANIHVRLVTRIRAGALDHTLTATGQRRRASLLNVVAPGTVGWPDTDRRMAAGMLDILWAVMPYERLVTAWELSPQQATRTITWVIGLIEAAIREGRTPETVARP
jgi:hypothetical protein